MKSEDLKRTGVFLIVSMFLMSGLMVLPSTVVAEQGQPDLVVRNIGMRFPVVEGEELPVTIYIQNIGDASVQDGFWIEVNYAELSGFWQEATETHNIWVEPPIKAGEIKAVEFTTIALNSYQVNFEAAVDTFDTIAESNEENNLRHKCAIAVGAAPGSSVNVPLYIRNENPGLPEIVTIEADATTIPEGWGITGGLPPIPVPIAPGANVIQIEGIIIPIDTILNPMLRINATRQSDGESRFIFITVLTTPEIGFSFNPYLNEFSAWGVDQIDSDVTITSIKVSQNGHKTVSEYVVSNTRGQYVRATVEVLSTKNLNRFKILEMEYNGVVAIIPEENIFMTSFLVDKNGELKHFHQSMKYDLELYSSTFYNARDDQTTMIGSENATGHVQLDGFDALGVRIWNAQVIPFRLDTSDTAVPFCPNFFCSYLGQCAHYT